MESKRVERADFAIAVPTSWTEAPGEDGVDFRSPDGSRQLIVSALIFKKPQGAEDRRATVQQLMQTRREAFDKVSGGTGQLLPTEIRDQGESYLATMVGASAAAGAMTFIRIVATQARVVTASVYRYGKLDGVAEFTSFAEEICGGLEVSQSQIPTKRGWRRWLPL